MTMGLPEELKKSLSDQESDLLRSGQRFRSFNKIRQREFYSTFLFPPGQGGVINAGTYEVFKTIKGGTGQGYASPLTERETNWPMANRVADNHNLVMKSIHCDIKRATTDVTCYAAAVLPTAGNATTAKVDLFVPPHAADVAACASGMILGITYLTNTVPIGYLSDFPCVGGVVGFNSAARQIGGGSAAALLGGTTPVAAGDRPYLPLTRNACNPAFERRAKVPTLLQHGETFSMAIIVPSNITLLDVHPTTPVTGEANDASGCLEVRISFWATESFIERS